jgi:hypothetical protein
MLGARHAFFGVRLQPGVAFALTRRRIHRIVNRRMCLSAMLTEDASGLEKHMAGALSAEEGVDMLEAFLLCRLDGVQIDVRVRSPLQQIETCFGRARIAQLARYCRVSSRNLNRLLRTWVELSPKKLARIVRFQFCCNPSKLHPRAIPPRWLPNSSTTISPTSRMKLRNSLPQARRRLRPDTCSIFPRHAANEAVDYRRCSGDRPR